MGRTIPEAPSTVKICIDMTKKYKITKARILQISNYISEEMCGADRNELIEVVKYFRDEFDSLWEKRQCERMEMANEFIRAGTNLLKP